MGASALSPVLGSSNFILCTFCKSRECHLMHVKHDGATCFMTLVFEYFDKVQFDGRYLKYFGKLAKFNFRMSTAFTDSTFKNCQANFKSKK